MKLAVLTGSLTAALLATVVLRIRNRAHRLIQLAETTDTDHDGIPDIYEHDEIPDDTSDLPGSPEA